MKVLLRIQLTISVMYGIVFTQQMLHRLMDAFSWHLYLKQRILNT